MAGNSESEAAEELVRRAAAGDRAAQHALFERYKDVIRQAVRVRRARQPQSPRLREDTEDLEQEAALHVLMKLSDVQWRGRRAFVAWLRQLIKTRVADVAKHHRAQRRDAGADTGVERVDQGAAPARAPESLVDEGARLQELHRYLDALKPEYALAVRMHHMGYTHAEIGDVLGCTPEAARKLVARGRAQLAQRWGT